MSRNRTLGACYIGRPVTSSEIATHERDAYYVEATLGSPVAITLDPFAKDGDQIFIQDANDNAGTQPITILASSSGQILNIGASVQITTNGGQIELTYSAPLGGWLVSNASAAAVVAQTLATFVLQPNGVTQNNVYKTEAELVTALAKVQGPREVELDGHLNGNAVTIGTIPWTGLGPTADITVRGNGFFDPNTSLRTTVNIANGARFLNDTGGTCIEELDDMTIFGPSAGGSPIPLNNSTLIFRNVQYISGGIALVEGQGANGGVMEIFDTSTVVVGPLYNGAGTSFTTVVTGTDGTYLSDAFTGAAGASLDLILPLGTGQGASISQPGFLGTLIIGPASNPVSGPLRFVSSPTPTVAGDVGMDLATGRLRLFVGGSSQEVAVLSDITGGSGLTNRRISGAVVIANGVGTRLLVDTSGGSFTQPFPAAPTDGQLVQFVDAHNPGTFLANPLTVSAGAGTQKIADPTSPGTYTAAGGNVLLGVQGMEVTFMWGATENTWFIVG